MTDDVEAVAIELRRMTEDRDRWRNIADALATIVDARGACPWRPSCARSVENGDGSVYVDDEAARCELMGGMDPERSGSRCGRLTLAAYREAASE